MTAKSSFPYEAVLWDIDGTLADSEPVHERSFLDACAHFSVRVPHDLQSQLLGGTENASYEFLVGTCGLTASFDKWTRARYASYLGMLDQVTFHPDAKPVWDRLCTLGVPQATVSNSDRVVVQANLTRLGLDQAGFVSVSRNDVRCGKPEPEPYLRAAHLLDIDPSRIAVIEDSATGMKAGVDAGMSVYLMPHFEGDAGRGKALSELIGLIA